MQERPGGAAFLKSQPQRGGWLQQVLQWRENASRQPASSPCTVAIGWVHLAEGIWFYLVPNHHYHFHLLCPLPLPLRPGSLLGVGFRLRMWKTFSCWNWCCILSWALSNMPSATCRSTPLLMTSFILSHAFLPVIWAASGKNDSHSHSPARTCLEIFNIRKKNKQTIYLYISSISLSLSLSIYTYIDSYI